mgnify:CR=1 FL=1
MKKTSTCVSDKLFYNMSVIMDNIALVYTMGNKSSLANIKTNELIGKIDNYYTKYFPEKKIFFQLKDEYTEDNKCITHVNIYDAKNEKYIVENFIYIDGDYSRFLLLKNPKTEKFHLFDLEVESIINEEFDDISWFETGYKYYFIIRQNDKKGLYKEGKGIEKEIEFDNISKICRGIIIEKDEQNFLFSFDDYGCLNNSILVFDKIKQDSNDMSILYCENNDDDKIYVYNSYNNYKFPCIFPKVDEIKLLKKDYFNTYLVKKNGKYGIYSDYNKKELVPIIYDKIEEKNGIYYLYKDGEVGLYIPNFNHGINLIEKSIDVKYDSIFCDNNTYILHRKDKYDLTTFDSENILEDCDLAESHYGEVIYKKDNRYRLFNCKTVTKDYENIIHRAKCHSKNLYITQENGLFGVIHSDKELLSTKYPTLEIYGKGENKNYDIDEYYFKFGNDRLNLAKFDFYGCKLNIKDGDFINIQFYKDVMLLDDGVQVIICDYNDKVLKTFPTGSDIQYFEMNKNGDKSNIYMVNQKYYFYKDGKFEEAFFENHDKYITCYETNNDCFEISTYNQKEHDDFCLSIDSQLEEEAEKYLSSLYENTEIIKERYPSLVLKKVNKINR